MHHPAWILQASTADGLLVGRALTAPEGRCPSKIQPLRAALRASGGMVDCLSRRLSIRDISDYESIACSLRLR